jgi:putative ABC transport system substrate-binding protein
MRTPLPPRAAACLTALALTIGLAIASPAAEVALVKSNDLASWRPAVEAVLASTSAHNVTEYDLAGSRAEGEQLFTALKGKVAIVVAMGPLAAQLAREMMPEVALVYCMVQDPVAAGLVGVPNAAGVALSLPARNQLVAFRTVNPQAHRIGVIFASDTVARQVDEAQKAAGALKLEVVPRRVADATGVPQAVRDLLKGGEAVDALWILPDPLILEPATRRFVLAEALMAGKPIYSFTASLIGEGALVSHSADMASIGQGVGELIGRILTGQKPERQPLLVPRGEVVINKKMADQLKVVVPAEALRIAQKVL